MSTAKITKKGQVTIPRDIRKFLRTQVVEFEVTDAGVLMKPVENVAGSLSRYAVKPGSFSEAREAAWNSVVNERDKR